MRVDPCSHVDVVWSVCPSVCRSRCWAVQKRLNRSRWRLGQGGLACGSSEPRIRWVTYGHHLANTTERSIQAGTKQLVVDLLSLITKKYFDVEKHDYKNTKQIVIRRRSRRATRNKSLSKILIGIDAVVSSRRLRIHTTRQRAHCVKTWRHSPQVHEISQRRQKRIESRPRWKCTKKLKFRSGCTIHI